MNLQSRIERLLLMTPDQLKEVMSNNNTPIVDRILTGIIIKTPGNQDIMKKVILAMLCAELGVSVPQEGEE